MVDQGIAEAPVGVAEAFATPSERLRAYLG